MNGILQGDSMPRNCCKLHFILRDGKCKQNLVCCRINDAIDDEAPSARKCCGLLMVYQFFKP